MLKTTSQLPKESKQIRLSIVGLTTEIFLPNGFGVLLIPSEMKIFYFVASAQQLTFYFLAF
jgi:hypothetical protein